MLKNYHIIMKKTIFLLTGLALFMSCKNETKTAEKELVKEDVAEVTYASFGAKIIADDAVDSKSMAEHFKVMTPGDSINTKMTAKVEEVCQAKGCWMKLRLEDSSQVFVKFKDYAFFMPKNIAGEEVIVNGKAFVTETSVEELRHYAEDAGESEEDIMKITAPKKTYAFMADGVLLKE